LKNKYKVQRSKFEVPYSENLRSRNPIKLFLKSRALNCSAILSRHASQFKRDAFAGATCAIATGEVVDNAT
jgi:hypothetical protein